MTKTKQTPAFGPAENVSTADELLDKLVAFEALEEKVIETKLGTSPATVCRILLIDADSVTDLGQRPIFWQVVRRQLSKATPEMPWIAGRLVQAGQAYRLDAYTDDEAKLIAAALAQLPD